MGGANEVLPLQKRGGGEGKVLAMPKGGTLSFRVVSTLVLGLEILAIPERAQNVSNL